MIKFNKLIIFLSIISFISYVSAMTQAVRKSPNVTRQALVAARTRVVRTPIRARSTLSMPKNQVVRQDYNQDFKNQQKEQKSQDKQSKARDNWVVTGSSIAAGIGIAALIEAQKIADEVRELYNMAMFDEDLISDQFSDAIVRFYDGYNSYFTPDKVFTFSQGSAFIIHNEKSPEFYFVATAAHCVNKKWNQYIELNTPQPIKLLVEPIIVDEENDVAILIIPSQEIKKFKYETGKSIPAIPLNQLSHVKPHKKEVVVLQGYPSFHSRDEPGSYREKLVSKGPAIWSGISGEQLFAKNIQRSLAGASGGPIVVIRDKQPQVIGVTCMQFSEKPFGMVLASGVGQLPEYIQNAEKITQEKRIEQEERVKKEKELQSIQSENWADYFRSFFWSK